MGKTALYTWLMGKTLMSRLREYRTAKALTQEQLAASVGVSRQTIVAVEKGNYVPSVALAMELSKCLDCPVETLFYWS